MKATQSKAHVWRYFSEDEFFWKNHLTKFKVSGLTRKAYCHENTLDYYRFTYWGKKLTFQQPQVSYGEKEKLEKPQLLSIQLKSENKIAEGMSPFSLHFKNGCVLHIHNEQALSIILEKMM